MSDALLSALNEEIGKLKDLLADAEADARRWQTLSDGQWEIMYDEHQDPPWLITRSELVGTPEGEEWMIAKGNTPDEAIDAAIAANPNKEKS